MTERFYISTAIYYANDRLHIGHCYESVLADALARYHRARGEDVFFLTGTDEHGSKVERRVKALGRRPQEWVDEIAGANQALFGALGVSYDDFIRTTQPRHREAVQRLFTQLYEQGDIYRDRYEGWYCQYEETYCTETKALPGHLCPECGRPLEWTAETAYKFRLSKYAGQVEALLEQPGFLVPAARRNEALAFVRQGLEDIAVSRAGLDWGIPVPFDPGHTVYVWIDALTNYLNALEGDRFGRFWPADLHVVGKDIARFHVVIWPALLLALGLPLPKQVYAHGWINLNGERISKSKGNVIDPWTLIDRYGADAVRYYLLRDVGFGLDASYSEEALVGRINSDLANDLGNLLSRTTQLINKFAGGVVPDPAGASDGVLEAAAAEAVGALEGALAELRIGEGLAALWRLVSRANKYVEEQAPWALAKEPAQAGRLGAVLYDLAEALRVTAAALAPFLVATPGSIYGQLGINASPQTWAETRWGRLAPGTAVRRGAPLFPRIEQVGATAAANASGS